MLIVNNHTDPDTFFIHIVIWLIAALIYFVWSYAWEKKNDENNKTAFILIFLIVYACYFGLAYLNNS
jgi:hypothetical protein